MAMLALHPQCAKATQGATPMLSQQLLQPMLLCTQHLRLMIRLASCHLRQRSLQLRLTRVIALKTQQVLTAMTAWSAGQTRKMHAVFHVDMWPCASPAVELS